MDETTTGTTSSGATETVTPVAPTAKEEATPDNNRTLMGVLAYIGILVLIPLLMEKTDPFVRFHVRQGLVLFVIEVAVWVVGNMIWMIAPLLMIVNLGALVLAIIGILNVINKKEAPLPLVGQFASHFKV